ncbi:MAG: ATP synthase subunit I [Deltaproteobacteria bacterium]|nr:ATP synthase subunit I [Deltaproteobacteria bacterium]
MSEKDYPLGPSEVETLKRIWMGNLITLAVLSAGALLLAPWKSALSVMIGGLIALINFRILQRNVKRLLLRRGQKHVMGKALFKYYVRFAITAVVLLLLVRQGVAEPLGLLVGLSVVVFTIMAWAAVQARKMYKEAY